MSFEKELENICSEKNIPLHSVDRRISKGVLTFKDNQHNIIIDHCFYVYGVSSLIFQKVSNLSFTDFFHTFNKKLGYYIKMLDLNFCFSNIYSHSFILKKDAVSILDIEYYEISRHSSDNGKNKPSLLRVYFDRDYSYYENNDSEIKLAINLINPDGFWIEMLKFHISLLQEKLDMDISEVSKYHVNLIEIMRL